MCRVDSATSIRKFYQEKSQFYLNQIDRFAIKITFQILSLTETCSLQYVLSQFRIWNRTPQKCLYGLFICKFQHFRNQRIGCKDSSHVSFFRQVSVGRNAKKHPKNYNDSGKAPIERRRPQIDIKIKVKAESDVQISQSGPLNVNLSGETIKRKVFNINEQQFLFILQQPINIKIK